MDAIEIGGKILIDGCARWNTSQVWSDGALETNVAAGANTTQFFDGIAAYGNGTGLISSSASGSVTNLNLPFNTKGEVFLSIDGTGPNSMTVTGSNGNFILDTPGYSDLSGNKYYDVSAAGSPITGFSWTNNASCSYRLSAFRADGEILVDGGSFGANGFHLPFDPAATGVRFGAAKPLILELFNA